MEEWSLTNMSKDDYQKKIDEHRQSIGVESEATELRRSRRNPPGKKKKKKNILIPSLFFIFILLPASVLIYVQFFYQPESEASTEDEGIIQVVTKPISNLNSSSEEEEEREEANETEENQTSEAEKPEDTTEVPQSTPAPPAVEPKEKEEAATPAPTQPKKETVQEPKKDAKTHIVKGNETLYRIAMNYYNNPEAVEKIKAANGLASNEIYEGQKLILP